MQDLRETVLYVARRFLKKLNDRDISLSTNRKGNNGITIRNGDSELERFLQENNSRRYYFHNTGHAHDIWNIVSNPIRTGINGLVCFHLCDLLWPDVKNSLYRRIGVRLGEKVNIGPRAVLEYFLPWLVEIGNYATVGMGAELVAHELTEDLFMISEIKIGEKAEIGAGAKIMPGVYVGKNAVVGSKAVVTHDVEDGKTVVGNPAREILLK